MLLDSSLTSNDLILRNLSPIDVNKYYLGWLTDPEVVRYLEIRFAKHSLESTLLYVGLMNDSTDSLLLGIFKHNHQHIGNIKLGPINPHHKRGEIGIMIGDRSCWGQGYGSEAIRMLTRYSFDVLKLHKLSSGTYADNEGSRQAFFKAGWKEEGHLPHHWMCHGEWVDGIILGINVHDHD